MSANIRQAPRSDKIHLKMFSDGSAQGIGPSGCHCYRRNIYLAWVTIYKRSSVFGLKLKYCHHADYLIFRSGLI